MKHGLRSKYGPPPALAEEIERLQNDPRLLSHVRIGATMQALLDSLLEKVGQDGKPTVEQIEGMLPVLEALRKAATDWHRLATDKRFVDLIQARQLFAQGLERVLRHVPEEHRELALADFEAVIGDGGIGGESVAADPGGASGSVH